MPFGEPAKYRNLFFSKWAIKQIIFECIVDASANKQGTTLFPYAYKIYPPEELITRKADFILIATQTWQTEVEKQLSSMAFQLALYHLLILRNTSIHNFL